MRSMTRPARSSTFIRHCRRSARAASIFVGAEKGLIESREVVRNFITTVCGVQGRGVSQPTDSNVREGRLIPSWVGRVILCHRLSQRQQRFTPSRHGLTQLLDKCSGVWDEGA
jgi:hypothetical protein